MSASSLPSLSAAFYEGEGSLPIPKEQRLSLSNMLLDLGHSIFHIHEKDLSALKDLISSKLFVLGYFEKEFASSNEIEFIDLGEHSSDEVAEKFSTNTSEKPWKPWFPVIDYDRCTNCMQCLTFCLFDVYGVDENKQLTVQHADKCKTNCPACSRVCPEVAIIFPKHVGGPINGDEVNEKDFQKEKVKVDISSLLGGNIYKDLRARSSRAKSRFSKERSPDKALKERVRCLKKLHSDGMIPEEVMNELDLSTLPSQEEIQRRSKELMEKMVSNGDLGSK